MLADILQLNIWDLNHVNTNIQPAVYQSTSAFSINNGLKTRLKSFGGHWLVGLKDLFQAPQPAVDEGDIVLYVTTQNQLSSLQPLLEQLPEGTLISDRNQVKMGARYPAFWAHLASIPFMPLTLFHFWRSRNKHDLLFLARNGLDRYLLTYGYYITSRIWLKRNRPGVVVVSNDSAVFQRTLCLAAQHEGIPTVYIQHASASPLFPPLMFDYALLDGSDAAEVYDRPDTDSQTKVFLVGMPKFDTYYRQVNRRERVGSIGIGVNMLDPEGNVRSLVAELRSKFPGLEMHLRPHPREQRMSMWEGMANEYNMVISDAKDEDVFAFLDKVDVIIAGNSSIHVEAVMLNVHSLTYNFQPDSSYQAYSFVERGLSSEAATPADVCATIEQLQFQKADVRIKAKPYCSTIGTSYDGQSSRLAAEIIQTVAEGKDVPLDEWQQSGASALTVYELTPGNGIEEHATLTNRPTDQQGN